MSPHTSSWVLSLEEGFHEHRIYLDSFNKLYRGEAPDQFHLILFLLDPETRYVRDPGLDNDAIVDNVWLSEQQKEGE